MYSTVSALPLFRQRKNNTKDSRRSLKPFSPHLPHAIATQPSLNEERFTVGNDFVFLKPTHYKQVCHRTKRGGCCWRIEAHPGARPVGKKERKKSVFHGELCDTSVSLRQKKSQRILGGMQRTVASFLSQSFLLPFRTTVWVSLSGSSPPAPLHL